jgi:hypothetical protein
MDLRRKKSFYINRKGCGSLTRNKIRRRLRVSIRIFESRKRKIPSYPII